MLPTKKSKMDNQDETSTQAMSHKGEQRRKFSMEFTFQKRLLAWDTFEAHMTEPVKKLLKEMKTDDALIPGGCTKYIQAPDVSWNKPFKSHIM